MELLDVLHMTTGSCVKAMGLLNVAYATVVSDSPLTITINASKLTVTEPVAVMTDNVRRREVRVRDETIVTNPGLVPGDKVLTLCANAGQNYIIISRV